MGKKLLNDKCLFKCKYGAVIKVLLDPCNLMHKDCSGIILTDKTQCVIATPIPVCPILTQKAGGQTPIPCSFMQLPGWSGADSKVKINGNAVLTVDSTTKCATANEEVSLLSPSACFANIGNVGTLEGVSDLTTNKNSEQKGSSSDNSVDSKKPVEASDTGKNAANSSCVNDKTPEFSVSNDEDNNKEQDDICKFNAARFECKKCETESKEIYDHCEYRLYATCNYKECKAEKKCKCDYFKTVVKIDNDSSKLRNNYREKFSEENEEYENLEKKNCQLFEEQGKAGFHNQAHHMISGNQILLDKFYKDEQDDTYADLKYGKLLKLALYCGFDVNCAENCILLPSFAAGKKVENSTAIGKPAQAYEIMSVMGRQWHVGNHSYELEKRVIEKIEEFAPRSAYCKKNKNQYAFSHYVASVEVELNDFVAVNLKKKQCWAKRNETNKNFKKEFLEKFKGKMGYIEEYLLNFGKDPESSYPFYVSLESVKYAFDLPTTSKVVFIFKTGFSTKAALVRVTRHKKDNNEIKFNIQKYESLSNDKTSITEFIKLCDNSTQLVIDEKIDFPLLFKALGINKELEFDGKGVGELFSKNALVKQKELEKSKERLAYFIKVSMAEDAFSKADDDRSEKDDNVLVKCYYEIMGVFSNTELVGFIERHTSELMAFLNQTQMEYIASAKVVSVRLNNIKDEV